MPLTPEDMERLLYSHTPVERPAPKPISAFPRRRRRRLVRLTPEDMEHLLYSDETRARRAQRPKQEPVKAVTAPTRTVAAPPQTPTTEEDSPRPRRRSHSPGNSAKTMSAKQLTNFWKRVDRSGGDDACWEWRGGLTTWGYGHFRLGEKHAGSHRVAYELIRGVIPEGLVIDHLCRNRRCCNPWHMEVVTNRENLLRGNGFSGRNVRKTHCPKGHPYDLVIKGHRYCSVCLKEAQRRHWQRSNRRRSEEYKHVPLLSRRKT